MNDPTTTASSSAAPRALLYAEYASALNAALNGEVVVAAKIREARAAFTDALGLYRSQRSDWLGPASLTEDTTTAPVPPSKVELDSVRAQLDASLRAIQSAASTLTNLAALAQPITALMPTPDMYASMPAFANYLDHTVRETVAGVARDTNLAEPRALLDPLIAARAEVVAFIASLRTLKQLAMPTPFKSWMQLVESRTADLLTQANQRTHTGDVSSLRDMRRLIDAGTMRAQLLMRVAGAARVIQFVTTQSSEGPGVILHSLAPLNTHWGMWWKFLVEGTPEEAAQHEILVTRALADLESELKRELQSATQKLRNATLMRERADAAHDMAHSAYLSVMDDWVASITESFTQTAVRQRDHSFGLLEKAAFDERECSSLVGRLEAFAREIERHRASD